MTVADDMTARAAARAHSWAVQSMRTHILHLRFEHGMTMAAIARRTCWPRSEVSAVVRDHEALLAAATKEDDRDQ